MASELGIDKMLCCAGWGDLDEDVEEAWKRSMDSLDKMLAHAHKAGVQLAFEILCPFESNLVYDLPTVARVMDTFQDNMFGLCVDTVPIRLSGATLEAFFEAFGPRICHVHLTDGRPTGHMPAGLGDHPWGTTSRSWGSTATGAISRWRSAIPPGQTARRRPRGISLNTVKKLLNA